jgi:outer membrane lipoprotein LolB
LGLIFLLLGYLLLTGCATTPPAPPPASKQQAWTQRQQQLQCAALWSLRGRMALAAQGKGWSARLTWQQQGDDFDMRLSGPLGWGGFRLSGDRAHVNLTGEGKSYDFQEAPERVIQREFGYDIPVSGLRYWMLGINAPDEPFTYQLNPWGQPQQLQQSGWTIDYAEYSAGDGAGLPKRLTMSRPGVRIKLLVDDWQLPEPICAAG